LGVAGRVVRHSLSLFTPICLLACTLDRGDWFEAPRILTTF
jgi:hypothetical protein